MKLIIQIPCYNEEETLGTTLSRLPRQLPGVDKIEWLVVDDGSKDRTAAVARENGADYIVTHTKNRGLAKTFVTGLESSLAHGADIIVNLDADNQYCSEYIGSLIQPIIEGRSDVVIGARPIEEISNFSRTKKILQKIGSLIVRLASRTDIPDAPSGFRAFSRKAAMHMRVYSRYTYTLETIIQAGQRGLSISWIPVNVNPVSRPSRLVRNIPSYLFHSAVTIIRIFVVYRPFRFFLFIGMLLILAGTGVGMRFLWYYLTGSGQGHIQSLILTSILIGIGFQTVIVAFVADLLSVNRRLLEDIHYRLYPNSAAERLSKTSDAAASSGKPSRQVGEAG